MLTREEFNVPYLKKNGDFVGFFGSNTTIEMINKYIADIEKGEQM
jgi:REP element-mobilizing transposase RayT